MKKPQLLITFTSIFIPILLLILGVFLLLSKENKDSEEEFKETISESIETEEKVFLEEDIEEAIFVEDFSDSDTFITEKEIPILNPYNSEIIGYIEEGVTFNIIERELDSFIIQTETSTGRISFDGLKSIEEMKFSLIEKANTQIETFEETIFYLDKELTIPVYKANPFRIFNATEEKDYYEVFVLGQKLFSDKSTIKKFKGIPVLMYHHLLQDKENTNFRTSTTMTPEQFEREMNYLKLKEIETINPHTLYLFLTKEINITSKSVLITFDDGLKSNLIYAAPILRENNQKAVNFLITSRVKDQPADFYPPKLQFLSKPELEEMSDVFSYQGHTHELHSFHPKTNKGLLISEKRDFIINDLTMSKEFMPHDYLAYPFGHYNKETLDILKSLNYKMAFTTKRGYVNQGDNLLELNRFGIDPSISFKEFREIVDR